MATIFDALPGIEVPVASISKSLASMWQGAEATGGTVLAVEDVKATQVNFVLHLGYATTVEDAVKQFRTAVQFSQRAPCRVVVLCPLPMEDTSVDMRGKIYGECHLGKTKGDARCCEFVMLSYPFAARRYLEAQLSVCLITDLPLYYWVHRFAAIRRLSDYPYLLKRSERILIDTAIVDPEILSFQWPRPEAVHDLVHARLLPVRQSIGQLLSAYEPAVLMEGLRGVTLRHGALYSAEARVLAAWLRQRLAGCDARWAGAVTCVLQETDSAGLLNVDFEYAGSHCFRWQGDLVQKNASVEVDFGGGHTTMRIATGLLEPDAALSEAMFF